MDNSPQNHEFWPSSVRLADLIGGVDQAREFGCGIVGRDPPGYVAEEILAILEAHTSRAEAPAEGVLEVMNANLRQCRPFPRL